LDIEKKYHPFNLIKQISIHFYAYFVKISDEEESILIKKTLDNNKRITDFRNFIKIHKTTRTIPFDLAITWFYLQKSFQIPKEIFAKLLDETRQ